MTELGIDLDNVHYVLTSTADRVFWEQADALPDDTATTRTRQTVGEMITVQPWESSVQQMLLAQEELEDIKF